MINVWKTVSEEEVESDIFTGLEGCGCGHKWAKHNVLNGISRYGKTKRSTWILWAEGTVSLSYNSEVRPLSNLRPTRLVDVYKSPKLY